MKKQKKERNSFTGTLSITSKGYGFVDISKNNGVFVAEKNMKNAFEGDFVRAKLLSKAKRECEIVEILNRGITNFTAICLVKNGKKYLKPYNNKITVEFLVKHEVSHNNEHLPATDGDLVVAEILTYPTASKQGTACITEVLGDLSEKGNDITVIMRKFGIYEDFSNDVLEQNIKNIISETELSKRQNFTNSQIITIDGEDAKDLDDAISVEFDGTNYTLGVHIADVSHYVKAKTPIDSEAWSRGTSVYLPDRVAPMLPKSLSNELCSLNPQELKLTLSCVMTVSQAGEILKYDIVKSYIKSAARMTYTNVKKILEGEKIEKYEFLEDTLNLMHKLYKILKKKRQDNGCIEFNFPETKFKLDGDGKAIDVFPYETSFANEIIEEFMLAANISVADFAIKNKLPFVYRVHGKPDAAKIENLYSALKIFGINFKHNQDPSQKELNKFLKNAENTEFKNIIHLLSLRSMQKAVYSENHSLHYGLNFAHYCHFTSPIRRYPDLLIHRIISAHLSGNDTKKFKKLVITASAQSTDTELLALSCEREVEDLKKAEYMHNKIGQDFSGVISGMCESGFFVALPNTVEGFVPLSSINDDFYEYYADLFMIKGRKNKNSFKIGQAVNVKLTNADVQNRKIDFILNEK